jgi:predicted RNA polymerase sigma factor
MKYTVLVYESGADFSARTDAGRKDAYRGAYRAYAKALTEAGVLVGVLKQLGRAAAAKEAYARAIGLCEDPAARQFLVDQEASA